MLSLSGAERCQQYKPYLVESQVFMTLLGFVGTGFSSTPGWWPGVEGRCANVGIPRNGKALEYIIQDTDSAVERIKHYGHQPRDCSLARRL